MILVQNHLLPLNGNKVITFFAIILLCSSCGTTSKTVKSGDKNKPVVKSDVKTSRPLLPDKVDTLEWKEIKTEKEIREDPVVRNHKDDLKNTEEKLGKISELNMLALLPFRFSEVDTSQRNIPMANLRFVQYYAGMKLAIDHFKKENKIPVQISIIDSGDESQFGDIVSMNEKSYPDVIIGPYRIESVKKAALWAKENKKIVISPWISSPSIADQNPYYFQAKAGLITHFYKINEHARANFPIENIILISKSKEESRLKIFNTPLYGDASIKEEIITEVDLSTKADPIIEKLLHGNGPTVFILPFASSRDENYVYHFLRRVSSEANKKEIYIYGLYKWTEMKPEILEYINRLNVRLSISNFVDTDRHAVKEFKRKYFEIYRDFPGDDAMEGHDLSLYLLRAFNKHGLFFYQFKDDNSQDYLETQFQFEPVYKDSNSDKSIIEYYENSYIKIVEVRDNRYKILD
jgi:hypothetical protein